MRFDQLKNMLTRRLTQKPELEKNSLKVGAMFKAVHSQNNGKKRPESGDAKS